MRRAFEIFKVSIDLRYNRGCIIITFNDRTLKSHFAMGELLHDAFTVMLLPRRSRPLNGARIRAHT